MFVSSTRRKKERNRHIDRQTDRHTNRQTKKKQETKPKGTEMYLIGVNLPPMKSYHKLRAVDLTNDYRATDQDITY